MIAQCQRRKPCLFRHGDKLTGGAGAIRKYGMYNIGPALASLDPLTRQAVEQVGFREICLSENISVERANFRMVYENLAERKKTEQQVALPLQQVIERLGSSDMLQLEEGR
jgi:hypothetical protein